MLIGDFEDLKFNKMSKKKKKKKKTGYFASSDDFQHLANIEHT